MTLQERRRQLTLPQQMANIGSEAFRMLQARRRGQTQHLRDATQRVLDLYYYTQVSPSIPSYRKKEIGRSKEVLLDYIFGNNIYRFTSKKIMNYYDFFAKR